MIPNEIDLKMISPRPVEFEQGIIQPKDRGLTVAWGHNFIIAGFTNLGMLYECI